MTVRETYNEIKTAIETQSTHDGLTAWANHELMHLDNANQVASFPGATGDDLIAAYEADKDDCLACASE